MSAAQTHYRFAQLWKRWAIITHGFLSHIDKRSIQTIEQVFQRYNISTIAFDLYAHGQTPGNIEEISLSRCYDQISEMNDIFIQHGITCTYVYGTSFSTLPITKFGNDLSSISTIFLKTPIFDYRARREREFGAEKIKQWEADGIIEIIRASQEGPSISQRYNFLRDYDDHFSNVLNESTKEIIVWAGVRDEKVSINEMRSLASINKIILHEFPDAHGFCDESNDRFAEIIAESISQPNKNT